MENNRLEVDSRIGVIVSSTQTVTRACGDCGTSGKEVDVESGYWTCWYCGDTGEMEGEDLDKLRVKYVMES